MIDATTGLNSETVTLAISESVLANYVLLMVVNLPIIRPQAAEQ